MYRKSIIIIWLQLSSKNGAFVFPKHRVVWSYILNCWFIHKYWWKADRLLFGLKSFHWHTIDLPTPLLKSANFCFVTTSAYTDVEAFLFCCVAVYLKGFATYFSQWFRHWLPLIYPLTIFLSLSLSFQLFTISNCFALSPLNFDCIVRVSCFTVSSCRFKSKVYLSWASSEKPFYSVLRRW